MYSKRNFQIDKRQKYRFSVFVMYWFLWHQMPVSLLLYKHYLRNWCYRNTYGSHSIQTLPVTLMLQEHICPCRPQSAEGRGCWVILVSISLESCQSPVSLHSTPAQKKRYFRPVPEGSLLNQYWQGWSLVTHKYQNNVDLILFHWKHYTYSDTYSMVETIFNIKFLCYLKDYLQSERNK